MFEQCPGKCPKCGADMTRCPENLPSIYKKGWDCTNCDYILYDDGSDSDGT